MSAESNEECCSRSCIRLPTPGCVKAKKEAIEIGQEICHLGKQAQIKRRVRNMCTVENAKKFLPITIWIRHYKWKYLWGDFIAGLTIGLTVIPQGLAQSSGIANLRPEYGLYSAFVGVILYAFFGTGKDCSLGPTAVASLLVSQYGAGYIPRDGTVAVALCLMTGIIQFAMGVLHIGIIADYISLPVISGFTTAAGITISTGQFKNWFGLKGIPSNVFSCVVTILQKLPETKWADFGMGLITMILLYWLKKLKDLKYKKTDVSNCKKVLRKSLWLIGIGRNVFLVLLTAILAKVLTIYNKNPFTLTGYIPPGMPPIRPPPFYQNVTVNATAHIYRYYGPSDFFNTMGAGIFVVPLLGIVENLAIGKEFGRKNGYRLDPDQEIVALGICNIVGSFFSSFSVTASFSRSALLSQSGGKSPLNGVFTGATVLLALGVLTPACYFIPTPCLAGVIIMACADLINFSIAYAMWKRSKLDLIFWFPTVVVGLAASIEYGLFTGIGLTVVYLLFPWSRQKIHVTVNRIKKYSSSGSTEKSEKQLDYEDDDISILKFSGGLLFPGVEIMRDKVMAQATKGKFFGEPPSPVILDFTHINYIDFTAIECLEEIIKDLHKHHAMVIFTNLKPSIFQSLLDAKIQHFLHYDTNDEAVKAIRETMKQNGLNKPYVEGSDNKGYSHYLDLSPGRHKITGTKMNGTLADGKQWWCQNWYDVLANEMDDELSHSEQYKHLKQLKESESRFNLIENGYDC